MNRFKRKFKKVKPFARFIFILLTLAYAISYIFFAKSVISLNDVETLIRYIILFILIIYFLFYILYSLVKMFQKKYLGFYLNSLLALGLIVLFCAGSYSIDFIYDSLAKFTEKNTLTYSSYLISLKDTQIDEDSTLGMISRDSDIEGNILAKKIIDENGLSDNEVKLYDDAYDMIYDLYKKDVDAVFVSGNYVTIYSSEADFANIGTDTKVVYKTSDDYENDNQNKSEKSLTEPVSVLIMGVDSEFDGLNANAAFNGDTLILATFNPDTLHATLLSIPRDTFVPIACRGGSQFKINSSAAYGSSCVIDTVENFTGIDIDYYVKINFKGVVDLVEALDGIEVDVEKPDFQYNQGVNCQGSVCEQNSDRLWGDKTVYITPGVSKLDGEQALAYARCRHLYAESDLARNRHQQDIILAIAKKVITIRKKADFEKVFDAVSKNISTNMTTEQILSGYGIIKDMIGKVFNDEEFINIQKSYLETYNLPVYLPSSGMTTSALGYYEDSLEDIKKAMRINLGLEKAELTKTFSYSINEIYEEKVAGKGLRGQTSNTTITNMVGKTKAEAESYCQKIDLSCTYTYVDENSVYYDESAQDDTVLAQNPHGGSLIADASEITFYIKGKSNNTNHLDD